MLNEYQIRFLLQCERDIINSGNALTPHEASLALRVVDNIEDRFIGAIITEEFMESL